MTKPRLFLFDPNLKSAGGHYLSYAMRIAEAAERLGIATVIVANAEAEADVSDNRILPLLELDYWQEMCPGVGEDPHAHLSASAECFAANLNRIRRDETLCDDDILFFPYINLAEVMGLARWKRESGMRLRTILLFRRDLDEQGIDASIGARSGAALLRQALADLYACPGNERVRLLTDTDHLTEEHGLAMRRRFQTAPIPVDPALFAPRPHRSSGTTTLVYLGDARVEKGYGALPSIARALKAQLSSGRVRMIVQSNFNVPGGEPGIAAARDFLSSVPNITLLFDPISPMQYNDYLLSADLILLPYQVERYVSRSSGIVAEAICAGVPALVPHGTWLADQVCRHGAGIVYDTLNPDGPARGVSEALASPDTLDALQARAAFRRGAYANFHRPARLAEFVCGADAIRAVNQPCLV
jgi:glycosyltransferase involved in cell wall biosynthesis